VEVGLPPELPPENAIGENLENKIIEAEENIKDILTNQKEEKIIISNRRLIELMERKIEEVISEIQTV